MDVVDSRSFSYWCLSEYQEEENLFSDMDIYQCYLDDGGLAGWSYCSVGGLYGLYSPGSLGAVGMEEKER